LERGDHLAEEECMKYGRHAVHVPDNIRDGNASYECVEYDSQYLAITRLFSLA